MMTIVSDFGLLLSNPYTVVVLAAFCVLFKEVLADMFVSAFSFTKSFLCVAFRFFILFASAMVYVFAMAFGQTLLHFTDKLFAVLLVMLVVVLLDTIISFAKKMIVMLFGAGGGRAKSVKVAEYGESRQFTHIPVACVRVFRLKQ